MVEPIARQVLVTGGDPDALARALADRLAGPELALAFVFADHRLDPTAFAAIQRALPAPVVGCTTAGVLGPGGPIDGDGAAVALGLYGDWLRVGIGVATELSKPMAAVAAAEPIAPGLVRGCQAVHAAAAALGVAVDGTALPFGSAAGRAQVPAVDGLDPARHVAITLLDGLSPQVEAFCIGAAASAPQLRFLGAGASADLGAPGEPRTYVWANGEAHTDAGVVVLLDSDQPFHVVTSSHLVASELKTVVTAARGRAIEELDGRPAATRLRQLIASIGDVLDEPRPAHALARFIDGVPYVRSMFHIDGERVILGSALEPGHILRVMRPGELVRTTQRALATAAERVGGTMAAFLAFSCMARHSEARQRGTRRELAAAYAAYPMVGIQTVSEQSGMLLVNHTLTGLAIGALKP